MKLGRTLGPMVAMEEQRTAERVERAAKAAPAQLRRLADEVSRAKELDRKALVERLLRLARVLEGG